MAIKLKLPFKQAERPQKQKKKKKPVRFFHWLALALACFAIMAIDLVPEQVSLTAGEMAADDVFYEGATVSFISEIYTEQERAAAAAAVEPIYVVDPTVTENLQAQVEDCFRVLAEASSQLELGSRSEEQVLADLDTALPGEYGDNILLALLEMSGNQRNLLRDSFNQLLAAAYEPGVEQSGLEAARQQIALGISAATLGEAGEIFLKSLLEGMALTYNKAYDAAGTNLAIETARQTVTPVHVTVQQGQKIVSRGAPITPEQIEILHAVGMQTENPVHTPYIGLLLLTAALLALLFLYLRFYQRQIYEKQSSLLLLGVVITVILLLCKLISLVNFSASADLAALSGFLLPVAAASMLLTVLLDRDTAIVATAVLAIFAGLIINGEMAFTLVAFAGGLTGIITATRLNQRSQFVGASIWIILTNLLLIAAWGMIWGMSYRMLAIAMLLGLVNGLLSAILAMGILPFLESAFGVTTVIRLLELANSNHPLLKRLMMEAPGTYNHSILLGNLAEAAADAIGANPLLVRVASYYHDIGKLKRPHFYIENQRPGENPHDKLQPALSAMIIISHIIDGNKMLKEYRFPAEIIDIVDQHHGSGVLSYFYHKAKQQAADPDEVKLEDYRYKGKKPQTREAALVMLADSVQAAVQALGSNDRAAMEQRVQEVIQGKVKDGQLQECPITLRDLETITQSFLVVLSGVNHGRITYPGQMEAEIDIPLTETEAADAADTDKDSENPLPRD